MSMLEHSTGILFAMVLLLFIAYLSMLLVCLELPKNMGQLEKLGIQNNCTLASGQLLARKGLLSLASLF